MSIQCFISGTAASLNFHKTKFFFLCCFLGLLYNGAARAVAPRQSTLLELLQFLLSTPLWQVDLPLLYSHQQKKVRWGNSFWFSTQFLGWARNIPGNVCCSLSNLYNPPFSTILPSSSSVVSFSFSSLFTAWWRHSQTRKVKGTVVGFGKISICKPDILFSFSCFTNIYSHIFTFELQTKLGWIWQAS